MSPSVPPPRKTMPKTATDWSALRAKFPPELITQVDKGFGLIDTVNHAVVTDRLQNAAPGWTFGIDRVVEVDGKDGMPHVLAIFGWIEIDGIRRHEVGEVERPSTYGDEAKKALSDLVKRAAMRFGVGTQLWAKEELPEPSEPPSPGMHVGAGRPPTRDGDAASSASRGSLPSSSAGGAAFDPTTDDGTRTGSSPPSSGTAPNVSGGSESPSFEEGDGASAAPSGEETAVLDTDGTRNGEGATSSEGTAVSRRDQLWLQLVQLAGSKPKAVNAVNKVLKTSFKADKHYEIGENDLEITLTELLRVNA